MIKQFRSCKCIFLGCILMTVLALVSVSCSKDDITEEEQIKNVPLNETEKKLVGGWPELGDEGITFLQDGLLIHKGNLGHWQYDEATGTLTTDVVNKKNKTLIWQILLLQNGSMSGIQLWDGSTFSAQRNKIQAVQHILEGNNRLWTRDKNSKFLVIDFYLQYYGEKLGYIEYSYIEKKEGISKGTFTLAYDKFSINENADLSSITIQSLDYGKYIIHNPYNYEKVWIEFPNDLIYYPVTENMKYLQDIHMSETESKLVGKWICKQQIFDHIEPGNKYYDDDLGMEFDNRFWCSKYWIKGHELFEGCSDQFSWWIKDNILCVDGGKFYIRKLIDNELELEWNDGDGPENCIFYKYDENSGDKNENNEENNEEDNGENTGNNEKLGIDGTYQGTLSAHFMAFHSKIEGTYDVKIMTKDKDHVIVTLPALDYYYPNNPQPESIPELVVSDIEINHTGVNAEIFIIEKDDFFTTIDGVNYVVSLDGKVDGFKIVIDYSIATSKIPMPINFFFSGTRKIN